MPSGKSRTKDDTWKEADLKKALQGEKKRDRGEGKSKDSSSDKRERRSDRDDDRRRRRETKDDVANGDREHRRREKDGDREKLRERDRGDRETGEKSSRDKDRRREKEKRRETEGETSGLGRDTGGHDREQRRTRDKEKDRDRDKDRDRERRHRSKRDDLGQDKENSSDREREKRKRKDEGESRSHKSSDSKGETSREHRDRRRERERDDSSRHKDEDREKRSERSREKDSRDRRKEHSDSRERREKSKDDRDRRSDRDRRKDDSRERQRDKSKDEDRKSRRKDKHDSDVEERSRRRKKEMLSTLKQEKDNRSKEQHPEPGKRFRADTLETADAVDEEDQHEGRPRVNSTGRRGSVYAEEATEMGATDDYDDDFEDYEDDFENDHDDDDNDDDNGSVEDRNAGMQELLKAINLENETVRALSREGSKISRSSDDETKRETPIRTPTTKGRINFVVAKQKQISEKVASRTRKRGQELMHLIDLDVAVFDIFDLPPMNEYELYIKNFGRSDTKQAYVQCNDDNLEKEIQTEDIETRTMWTQNPPEDSKGCGGEDSNKDELSFEKNQLNIDSVRLSRFLQSAGQVCLVLLEEAVAEHSSTMVKEKKEMSCSSGYIPLVTKQPYLAGRVIESIHVSPVQSHLLLTAYGPVVDQSKVSSKITGVIGAKSIVCLWNVNEPSQPQKILICESVPRCCCLSPSKATIAFAGLEDGTVVSWDLRESSPVHYTLDIDNTPATLRPPTFSTAGVLSQDNHHSPVVELRPVVMPGDRSLLQEMSRSAFSAKASSGIGSGLKADELLGLSFQLASLEEDGIINIWVVVEMEAADIAGSESDLGLAPGGRIKLIKSGSLTLDLPLRGVRKTTALQAFCMRFLPQDPNHFYVGTDSGCVLHNIRHGGRAPPKAYKPVTDCLVDVTAIDVAPWQLPCLLAGSRDGSIRLYHLNNEYPQSTWSTSTNGSAIVSIQWSNSIPSVFYVLDDNSNLYIWDLLQDESAPVSIDRIKQGRLVCFELTSDYSASGIGVPGRSAELVLGYQNGVVEVHNVSSRFGKPSADGLDRFHSYLEASL